MRIAHWDCPSGIAGDMVLGAIVGCGMDAERLAADLSGLALPGFRIEHRRVQRGVMAADKVDVIVEVDDPQHRGLADIREILAASDLPAGVAERADDVFFALCEAEAAVHGMGVDKVHLHDVGAIDAIVDIVGACIGLQRLGIERLTCSPLNVGAGTVGTAHGVLPVPAPATAELLRGAPVYTCGPETELVTPTGAALVAVLTAGFGGWPEFTIDAVGYGAGDKDLEGLANVMRMVVGTASTDADRGHPGSLAVIETNIDDMSPELFGPLTDSLLAAGALDAYTTPALMKKGRPGVELTVLTPRELVDVVADLLFRETTTLGVRSYPVDRRELERKPVAVTTPWGDVVVKVAELGGEVMNVAPEFDSCKAIADANEVPVKRVIQAAIRAFGTNKPDGPDM